MGSQDRERNGATEKRLPESKVALGVPPPPSSSSLAPTSYANISRRTLTFPPRADTLLRPQTPPELAATRRSEPPPAPGSRSGERRRPPVPRAAVRSRTGVERAAKDDAPVTKRAEQIAVPEVDATTKGALLSGQEESAPRFPFITEPDDTDKHVALKPHGDAAQTDQYVALKSHDDAAQTDQYVAQKPDDAAQTDQYVAQNSGEDVARTDPYAAIRGDDPLIALFAEAPPERPSDRSTVPTLDANGAAAADSDTNVVEVSVNDVELASDPELQTDPVIDLVRVIGAKPSSRANGVLPPPLPEAPAGQAGDASLHTLVRKRIEELPPVFETTDDLDENWATSNTLRPSPLPDAPRGSADARSGHEQLREAKPSRFPHDRGQPQIVRGLRPRQSFLRRALVPIIISHAFVAVAIGIIARSTRTIPGGSSREPHVALQEHTPLAGRLGPSAPVPPFQGCTTVGASRMLAPHAQIGSGLDVTVLDTGFAVGMASSVKEVVGVRVVGSGLRVAETVRMKSSTPVGRVAVDPGRDDEGEGLDVRLDTDEARTVIGASAGPAFRIVARGGGITAYMDDLRGVRARTLWHLPGAARSLTAPAPASAPAPVAKSVYRPEGIGLPETPARAAAAAAPVAHATELVRAAGRDDGGAVIAIRQGSTLWLGMVDAGLAPVAPLLSIARRGATLGAPTVTSWGGGGAVAWAEKPAGEQEWVVVVAGFTPDGAGGSQLGPLKVIGKGMSPSLAELPDGDLLLAHAEGPSGGHRVVALRLARDMAARGTPVVVSPESINAGQPVAAVRADGTAMVAFFAADHGRSGSVHATSLTCDTGL